MYQEQANDFLSNDKEFSKDEQFIKDQLKKYNLPRKGSHNRNKDGQRIPMTEFQANAHYNKPIDVATFQRTAQKYYKTSRTNQLLWLFNEVTKESITINFNSDMFGYMRMTKYIGDTKHIDNHIEILIKKPETNNELFLKLITKRYI